MKEICICSHSKNIHVDDYNNTRCCATWKSRETGDTRMCECMEFYSRDSSIRKDELTTEEKAKNRVTHNDYSSTLVGLEHPDTHSQGKDTNYNQVCKPDTQTPSTKQGRNTAIGAVDTSVVSGRVSLDKTRENIPKENSK